MAHGEHGGFARAEGAVDPCALAGTGHACRATRRKIKLDRSIRAVAALAKQAMITTINYENVEWLADGYGDRWPFDMVIADESTRLKGLRVLDASRTADVANAL